MHAHTRIAEVPRKSGQLILNDIHFASSAECQNSIRYYFDSRAILPLLGLRSEVREALSQQPGQCLES